MAMADPEPGMQRAVVKGTSTPDRVRSIVLVIGYALSVVAALGVLFVGFTSLTADPSVSCARSLGKVDQGMQGSDHPAPGFAVHHRADSRPGVGSRIRSIAHLPA